MFEYTRRSRATALSLALAALTLGAAACGGDKQNPLRDSGALASDSALNRDLQLAGGDTAAQPQLQDVPADSLGAPAAAPAAPARTATRTPARTPARTTTRPSTSRPAPAAPTETRTPSGNVVSRNPGSAASGAAGGAVGIIASGSTLSLASASRVCTNTKQVGDVFTATVTDAVTGSNGATIPRGARVTLRITRLKRSENMRDPIVMEFDVVSVAFGGQTYQVDGRVASANVDRVRNQPREKDVQKVVGGAVIGAIAGQVLGKDTRSTVTGAAAGAAAGAATAAATSNYEGCVPEGGSISVVLESGLQVRV
ncbi:MAG TPA: hypothetical protein VEA99_21040 [Gemmatimonadaceae bacterium]|nr:hypothetical protein [Gemmatimonadaceae bacterium]